MNDSSDAAAVAERARADNWIAKGDCGDPDKRGRVMNDSADKWIERWPAAAILETEEER